MAADVMPMAPLERRSRCPTRREATDARRADGVNVALVRAARLRSHPRVVGRRGVIGRPAATDSQRAAAATCAFTDSARYCRPMVKDLDASATAQWARKTWRT